MSNSTPTAPVLVGSVATSDSARGVTLIGDFVYASDFSTGLQILEVSDAASPILAASVDTPGLARAGIASGRTGFVADFTSGLRVIGSEILCPVVGTDLAAQRTEMATIGTDTADTTMASALGQAYHAAVTFEADAAGPGQSHVPT